MSGLMVLFVTFLVVVTMVYSIKFSGPSVSTVIEQLKEESTKQNMKIDQLIMEKNQLKDEKDELEEKLANQMQTEKEEVLNEKIEDLQKELLKFKESQKGIVDAAFHWLTSSFNSLKKQAEHTFYSIIWKKMWEYIQVLF